MFFNLLANLTILPAIIVRAGLRAPGTPRLVKALPPKLARFPQDYPKVVIAGMLLIGATSALLLPMTYFDYNPLNLADPESEAIITARELMEKPKTSIWTINVLAQSSREANRIAGELEKLEVVDSAVTLDDLVPENQMEKLMLIRKMSSFVPFARANVKPARITPEAALNSVQSLIHAMERVRTSGGDAQVLQKDFLTEARELARVLQ